MGIRSDNEIYSVVEKALRKAGTPQTCVELMMNEEVRSAALNEFGDDVQIATNKLSDTLGFMWRRDVLNRHLAPATGTSRSRYSYSWRDPDPAPSSPLPAPTGVKKKKKPVFTITESDEGVRIEFEHVTLLVRKE